MGLTLKKTTGVANRAYSKPLTDYKDKDGNPLPKVVKYDFSWYEYEDDQSMIDAKDELTLEEQRKVRNIERKTKARQAANTAALDALGIAKPNAENDSQIRLKAVYTGIYAKLVAKGMDKDEARVQAREKAAEILDEQWDDEDDE